MKLTENQIDLIARLLADCGIAPGALHDDLLDHICTDIENSAGDFESALKLSLVKFGGSASLPILQRQTRFALQHREKVRLARTVHRTRYGFGFLLIIATMFKLMHWPYGNILLVTAAAMGFAFLLAVLYKRARQNQMEKLTT